MLKVAAQLVSQLSAVAGALVAALSERISSSETIMPGVIRDIGLVGIAVAVTSTLVLTIIAALESRDNALRHRLLDERWTRIEREIHESRLRANREITREKARAHKVAIRAFQSRLRWRLQQLDERLGQQLSELNRALETADQDKVHAAAQRLRESAAQALERTDVEAMRDLDGILSDSSSRAASRLQLEADRADHLMHSLEQARHSASRYRPSTGDRVIRFLQTLFVPLSTMRPRVHAPDVPLATD